LDRRVRIEREHFDVAREWSALRASVPADVGAVVAFCGYVRDLHGDEAIAGLELEHFPGMTEKSLDRILDAAEQRWRLTAIHVVHRVGRLAPTEPIVLVLTASSHRAEAFAACEFVMDYLKTEAIFWKKERSAAGERWVEATAVDQRRRAAWRED
jgi:molybdopterin synthase catalytic subunit